MIARIFTAEKEPVFCTVWLETYFTKTEKERQKKTVQLNIYKQIITWELLFDLLLAVVYFLFKIRFLLH